MCQMRADKTNRQENTTQKLLLSELYWQKLQKKMQCVWLSRCALKRLFFQAVFKNRRDCFRIWTFLTYPFYAFARLGIRNTKNTQTNMKNISRFFVSAPVAFLHECVHCFRSCVVLVRGHSCRNSKKLSCFTRQKKNMKPGTQNGWRTTGTKWQESKHVNNRPQNRTVQAKLHWP